MILIYGAPTVGKTYLKNLLDVEGFTVYDTDDFLKKFRDDINSFSKEETDIEIKCWRDILEKKPELVLTNLHMVGIVKRFHLYFTREKPLIREILKKSGNVEAANSEWCRGDGELTIQNLPGWWFISLKEGEYISDFSQAIKELLRKDRTM